MIVFMPRKKPKQRVGATFGFQKGNNNALKANEVRKQKTREAEIKKQQVKRVSRIPRFNQKHSNHEKLRETGSGSRQIKPTTTKSESF